MQPNALSALLRLRYRLLWAQVRTRNGKIVLALVGYLILSLIAGMLALGGVGGAIAAVRLGKSELVARAVLSAAFLCVTLAAVLFGVGMRQSYSDGFLRRYALRPLQRLAARHLIAALEPIWILALTWYVGLAAGFVLLDVVPWWKAVPAAVLLLLTNYLLARALLSVIEYAMATRSGPFLLLTVMAVLFPLPSVLGPMLSHNPAALGKVLAVLSWTPPFAAASVMSGARGMASAGWLLLLVGYCAVFAAALVRLDRLPPPSRTVAGAKAAWDDVWDRIAAVFGPELAPLIGKILRYYARSPQLRFNYPLSALWVLLLTFQFGRGSDPMRSFLAALGAISGVGSMSMGAMTMNVFGFDGSGFRRYFLVPVAPAIVLRAAAVVPLILGAALIPISLGVWLAVSRVPLNARMMLMLLSSGLGGTFLFQALGIWTSMLAPRAIEFKATFGNKLSLAANALMMGNMFVMFGLMGLFQHLGVKSVLAYWWLLPLAATVAAAFYLVTLRAGAAVFVARRERMLSMIERGFSF